MYERSNDCKKRPTRKVWAFLQINEDHDATTFMQSVVGRTRSLTGASYGMMTLLEDGGWVRNCLISGLSPSESQEIRRQKAGLLLFEQNQSDTGSSDEESPDAATGSNQTSKGTSNHT